MTITYLVANYNNGKYIRDCGEAYPCPNETKEYLTAFHWDLSPRVY